MTKRTGFLCRSLEWEVTSIEPRSILVRTFDRRSLAVNDTRRPMTDNLKFRLATLAIRAGHARTHEGEHSEPIFPTSSFVFKSAAQAAARFSEAEKGNIYSRFTNPTVRAFEERLAAMEGGEVCVGTASGMSAILSLCMALLKSGDHVVCSESVFGTTIGLLTRYLGKFDVATTYVRLDDNNAWRKAIKPNTKLFFLETPSNPLSAIGDIRAIADIAHERNIVFCVDNCFCTPAL